MKGFYILGEMVGIFALGMHIWIVSQHLPCWSVKDFFHVSSSSAQILPASKVSQKRSSQKIKKSEPEPLVPVQHEEEIVLYDEFSLEEEQ